jgi:hypothetical protein
VTFTNPSGPATLGPQPALPAKQLDGKVVPPRRRSDLKRDERKLAACGFRPSGPAGSTAALPQISFMEPIKTPFPRAHGAPYLVGLSALAGGGPTAAVEFRQRYRFHTSGTALGHGGQYRLRGNRCAVAVPRIGPIYRTSLAFNVT